MAQIWTQRTQRLAQAPGSDLKQLWKDHGE